MAKKRLKNRERTLFIWLMAAGIIACFAPQSLMGKLQLVFVRIFNRPLSICRNFTQTSVSQHLSANVVDERKYIELQNHLANTMQWLRQERQNVEKLSGLRNRSIWKGVDFVLADIITSFTDAMRNEFIINRGIDDGLAQGQFVFTDHSIIGVITDIDSCTARVQLLTDSRSKVTVKIGEFDFQCIMHGNGDGSANIQLVSKKYEIKNGDVIYVQKKPGFLDVPMIAGTVSQCNTDEMNPLLWEISVAPTYNMKEIDSVTVIIMNVDKYDKVEIVKAAT